MRFFASSGLLFRFIGVFAVLAMLFVSLPPVQTMAEAAGATGAPAHRRHRRWLGGHHAGRPVSRGCRSYDG